MLDYSAFDEQDYKKYNGKLPGLPKISSPLTAFIFVSLFFLALLSPVLVNPVVSPFSFLLVIGLLYFVYRITWRGRETNIKTALFAHRNKFGYSWQGGKFKNLQGLGSVLGEPNMSNVVTGHFQGQKFTLCGVYSNKVFKNVMRVTLPNRYPHMILDAKQNDLLTSSLHKIFPKNKEIELEGDFPKYFRLFTATDPIETLQIFSPELMARMIDYARMADVEILDDQLLLICNFGYQDKETVHMLFTAVEQILKDLGKSSNNSRVDFNSESRILKDQSSKKSV